MDDLEKENEGSKIVEEISSHKNESPARQQLIHVQRDSRMARVNKALLVYKAFYFVFYSALGSTIPFFPGYFRQIGLAGSYLWILSAVRPFAQMCFSPLWGILADRYLSKKMILQFSLFVWFVLVISLAFVEPTDQRCQFVSLNHTDSKVVNSTVLKTGFFRRRSLDAQKSSKGKRSAQNTHGIAAFSSKNNGLELNGGAAFGSASGALPSEDDASGNGPTLLNTSTLAHNKTNEHFIRFSPQATLPAVRVNFTTRNELKNSPSRLYGIFLTALVLLLLCELFLCPVFVLVDADLLSKQTEERFSYGQQRVFGSLGYAVVFLIVWLLLNHSLRPVCGAVYADYVICFCCFCVVTLLTLVLSVRLDFAHHSPEPDPYARLKSIFHNRHHGTFAVAICFAGFSHAVISNFFNKFLEESSEKNGVIGVVKFFYFLGGPLGFLVSSLIINRSGSINVIFAVLTSYTVNLFACSFISCPWHLLPLGFLETFTYAVSWVVCATYVINYAPHDCAAIVQGVLQSIYWGCGGFLGLIIGGSLINMAGHTISFRLFTVMAVVVTVIFTIGLGQVNFRDRNYYTLLIGTLSQYTGDGLGNDPQNINFPHMKWEDCGRQTDSGVHVPQNMPFPLRYLATDNAERRMGDWDIQAEGKTSPQRQEMQKRLRRGEDEDDDNAKKIFM